MKRYQKILTGTVLAVGLIYCILIIIAYLPYETTPIEELTGEESRFVEVKGNTIHYTRQGTGKPVILVHGFAGSTYTWRYLIPLLADRYTVYACDVLGFGLSDKPSDGQYDMQSHGQRLIDFMDALNIPSAHLIGHSMGGVIIAYASLAAPDKAATLVMVEPGFYMASIPPFLNYLFFPLDRIMARQFYTRSMRERFFMGSFYNTALVTDEVIDAYMLPTRTPNALEAMARMMSTVGVKNYEDVTEQVTRPTLIVWGERGPDDPLAFALRIEKEREQPVLS